MIVLVTETWCKAFTNAKINEPVSHLPEWPHLARAQPCDLFLVRIFRLQKPNQNLKLRKYVTHPLNIFACLRKFINLHNQPKSLHKSGALLASYKMYFVPVISLMWILSHTLAGCQDPSGSFQCLLLASVSGYLPCLTT